MDFSWQFCIRLLRDELYDKCSEPCIHFMLYANLLYNWQLWMTTSSILIIPANACYYTELRSAITTWWECNILPRKFIYVL